MDKDGIAQWLWRSKSHIEHLYFEPIPTSLHPSHLNGTSLYSNFSLCWWLKWDISLYFILGLWRVVKVMWVFIWGGLVKYYSLN